MTLPPAQDSGVRALPVNAASTLAGRRENAHAHQPIYGGRWGPTATPRTLEPARGRSWPARKAASRAET